MNNNNNINVHQVITRAPDERTTNVIVFLLLKLHIIYLSTVSSSSRLLRIQCTLSPRF